jgi:cytochrome c556
MKFAIVSASIHALAMTAAASASPVVERGEFMKQNGRLLGAVAPVVKGEQPFDAADVLAALEAFNQTAQSLDPDALFPAGSEGGEAAPAIWSDRAGFEAAVEEYKAAAAAAVEAQPHDVDALRVSFGRIGASCANCHQTYRIKKN